MEQTQGVPAGPYTVEKHGDGFAIYTGRNPFHHGMNWGQLTECDEALAKAIERGLNMLSAAPQAQPVTPAIHDTICRLLQGAMDVAVENGANSVSMPDEYVELALWLSQALAPAQAQPVREPMGQDQMLTCIGAVGTPIPMGLTRDRGPYEITEPSQFLIGLVRAIERHHGIGSKGGAE